MKRKKGGKSEAFYDRKRHLNNKQQNVSQTMKVLSADAKNNCSIFLSRKLSNIIFLGRMTSFKEQLDLNYNIQAVENNIAPYSLSFIEIMYQRLSLTNPRNEVP